MPILNSDQSDELEALSSIYSSSEFFLIEGGLDPQIKIVLDPSTDTPSVKKWVGLVLFATFPSNYPSTLPPKVELQELKGIDEKQTIFLEKLVTRISEENAGAPCIYAIAEAIREWLSENNVKPSDGSAFDEMMREKSKASANNFVTSNNGGALRRDLDPSIEKKLVTTETNAEMVARKKREGTPVTRENFLAWRSRFEKEMEAKAKAEEDKNGVMAAAMSGIAAQKAGRLTGRQLFEADSTLAQSDLGLESSGTGGKVVGSMTSAGGDDDVADVDYKQIHKEDEGEDDENDEEDEDYDDEDEEEGEDEDDEEEYDDEEEGDEDER